MEANCHKPEELLKTIQLQNDHIRQLTDYNTQCLENSEQQNRQIELLSRQLTDAHSQQQQLLQRIQQLQQPYQSRDRDVTQLSPPVLLNGSADESMSRSLRSDADSRIAQLEAKLGETQRRLEESERQRLIVDEQAEKSRRTYESEIALLKVQLSTFEEDFKSERRAREATAVTLDRVRDELTAAQAQLHQYSLQQMQDVNQRRTAALEYHRLEYERNHPHHNEQQQQQPRQRPIYQTDSMHQLDLEEEEGEDEID